MHTPLMLEAAGAALSSLWDWFTAKPKPVSFSATEDFFKSQTGQMSASLTSAYSNYHRAIRGLEWRFEPAAKQIMANCRNCGANQTKDGKCAYCGSER